MMNDYKGYSAKFVLDEEQSVFFGEVIGINDVVTFEGDSVDKLVKAFHESVDDYLEYCQEQKKEPNKPYSGRFVVRVDPELHRNISIAASKADTSMNEFVVSALENAIERKQSVIGPKSPDRASHESVNEIEKAIAVYRYKSLVDPLFASVIVDDWIRSASKGSSGNPAEFKPLQVLEELFKEKFKSSEGAENRIAELTPE